QIVEVDQSLVSVVDRRTGKGSLLVTGDARPGDVVLAIRELNVQNVQGHRANVGPIAQHVLASAGRSEVVISGMILRATGGSQRRDESRRGPVARWNRRQQRGGHALRSQPILLAGSLIAAEDEQLVLLDGTA